jgi:hypothetical protein
MKKTIKPFLLFASFVWLLSLACSKKGSSIKPPSNMDLITQSSWKYDTAGIGSDNSGTIVLALPAGTIKDCQKDNIITFKSDGTGTEDEGPIKCDSLSPQTTPFTWSFNASQTQITSSDSLFTGVGGAITITSLTQTQLHLLKSVTIQSVPVILDIYLKH